MFQEVSPMADETYQEHFMDLSIPLGGIETATASFDSASRSIVQAFNTGLPSSSSPISEDSVSLSGAVGELLASKLSFLANEKTAIVEDNLNRSTFSLLA